MWYKGKRLLLTTLAAGLLYTTTAFAANVQMDLFYNGAHHAYNAKEIAIVIDGESYTDPNMPAGSLYHGRGTHDYQRQNHAACSCIGNSTGY